MGLNSMGNVNLLSGAATELMVMVAMMSFYIVFLVQFHIYLFQVLELFFK